MKELGEKIREAEERIAAACRRAGRDPDGVEIVAVTKTHGADVVSDAWRAGLAIMGENKVQEAAWKKPVSPSGPEWHLIGRLQANKVRKALALFDFFHSIDSVQLLSRMQTIAGETGAAPHVLLEVNVSGEKTKGGFAPGDAAAAVEFAAERCPRITVEGFMTMAPFSPNREDSRPVFRKLRELRDAIEKTTGAALPRLSMGMSGDFETAVEEGATWVRLGTLLFGDRPKLKSVRATGDETDGGGGATGGLDSYSGAGPTVRILD